jgi:hypothetical protein
VDYLFCGCPVFADVIAQRVLDKLGQVFQLQYVMPGSDSAMYQAKQSGKNIAVIHRD